MNGRITSATGIAVELDPLEELGPTDALGLIEVLGLNEMLGLIEALRPPLSSQLVVKAVPPLARHVSGRVTAKAGELQTPNPVAPS